MSSSTYFLQKCPSCSRQLQVRLEYLGRSVLCQHCSRQFMASTHPLESDASEVLLIRADELLASVQASREFQP